MLLRLACLLALAAPAATGGDVPEPGSAEAIRAATTEPRFLSPWVASVPDSASVASPSDELGRIAGAPGELATAEQAQGYFRKLAASSPRARVILLGQTEEGRDILALAIADEAGIGGLDALKAATAALADPRKTTPEQAAQLVASSRPFYYLNAGLHSDETGSTEATMELAYRLIVSEDPRIQEIRKRLVVFVNPVGNPDGRDRVVEWFYRFLKGKTDYDSLPRQSPPYWSDYAFVDINRDAHQLVHASARAAARMMLEYHPTIIHDLHEAIALLLTWNGTGPWSPNIDPITTSEMLELSFHEVQTLTALGMPGVSTWKFGEGFGQHYLDSIANNHNALGRGYETWGNSTAETVRRVLDESSTTREWWRPLPPPREFVWSARDNVNYTETAALAALDYSARHAGDLLMNFYRKGFNSWQRGLTGSPRAFVIPDGQGDRLRVAQLVERLQAQGIEVGRATAPLRLSDGDFPAGSYVVRLDQPYRNYAVDLLAPQHYPMDSGIEPYDDISWSLPVHYHLEATAVSDPAAQNPALSPLLREAPRPAGVVSGAGPVYLLKDTGQESLLAARYRLAGFEVEIAETAFRAGGEDYPAGSWILQSRPGLPEALGRLASELGLDFASAVGRPDVARHAAPAPRLGLWVPWADTDSIGWIRYSLDHRKVPYSYVRDEDIRSGAFRAKTDVLLYGHVDLELAEQIQGLPKIWGPMPYKKTPQTPSHGCPAESDDITGGIGWEGMAQLQGFVEEGGLLVTLGSGSALALEGGIVRGVRRSAGGVPRSTDGGGSASAEAAAGAATRTPGAHLRVHFTQPAHPLAYGYASRTWVFRQNFPLYDVPRRFLRMAYCTSCLDGPEDRRGVVMEWGDGGGAPFVVSGGAWGEAGLIGRPAVLDMPVGRGRAVSFNFNPMHRDLNRGDQRLLWNALLNWRAILARPRQ
jgi:Zinc carboxypeptidase